MCKCCYFFCCGCRSNTKVSQNPDVQNTWTVDEIDGNHVLENNETGECLLIDPQTVAISDALFQRFPGIIITHIGLFTKVLEGIAFKFKFTPGFPKPKLIIPTDLVEPLWKSLSLALENPLRDVEHPDLSTYFEIDTCLSPDAFIKFEPSSFPRCYNLAIGDETLACFPTSMSVTETLREDSMTSADVSRSILSHQISLTWQSSLPSLRTSSTVKTSLAESLTASEDEDNVAVLAHQEKVVVLGHQDAFKKLNSSIYIETNGKILLIDAGHSLLRSIENLSTIELSEFLEKIHGIFITHWHADHAAGLVQLAVATFLLRQTGKCQFLPKLFVAQELAFRIWDDFLSPHLAYLPGIDKAFLMEDFFEVEPLRQELESRHFKFDAIALKAVEVEHVDKMLCFGTMITLSSGEKIFYTGDTRFTAEKLMPYYEEANLIIHDCLLDGSPGFVHATVMQLLSLPELIKAKMLLHHYDARKFELLIPDIQERIKREFRGFTSPGLDLKNLPQDNFLNPFGEIASFTEAPAERLSPGLRRSV